MAHEDQEANESCRDCGNAYGWCSCPLPGESRPAAPRSMVAAHAALHEGLEEAEAAYQASLTAEKKREQDRKQELKVFLAGPDVETTLQCMHVGGCQELRWSVPTMASVLCKGHTMSVLCGLEKAPPLRRSIDYQSVGRKTFLVEQVPGWPVMDDGEEPKKP